MNVIDSTDHVRLIETGGKYEIQRHHPRTGWFTAFSSESERDGRSSLGSLAELVGEMDQLSAETMRLR